MGVGGRPWWEGAVSGAWCQGYRGRDRA